MINLITGCSQSATSVFKNDPIYAQNIQYTKIGKIVVNNEVVALVNITYLNSVDSSKWDNGKQNFIVGEYISENTNNILYTLKLNNQNYTQIKDISKDDKIYKNIAFRNEWAIYTLVSFDDTNNKTLTLTYSNTKGDSTSVSFIKE